MQVRLATVAVGQALDLDHAEHRLQRAGVPGLDPTMHHALIAHDLLKALLADRAQREMIIEQPPQ